MLHRTSAIGVGHDDAEHAPATALTVVMAAKGYPGTPAHGGEIRGIEAAEQTGAIVFQAGTSTDNGRLVAAGSEDVPSVRIRRCPDRPGVSERPLLSLSDAGRHV